MSTRCPSPEQLAALEDGEASENEAASLREHMKTCAPCADEYGALGALRADLGKPVVDLDVERFARRVERAMQLPAPRSRLHLWIAAAAVLAVAGTAAAWQLSRGEDAEFAARGGGAAPSARRDVALSLFEKHDGRLAPLSSGARVKTDAVFAMSWATKSARAPHRAVVIAVDASREVHWMYPSFLDPAHVPPPIELAPGRVETPMSTVVRLDAPAAGPLIVIALLDPADGAVVQRIEDSRHEERTVEGLRALVRAEDVRSWSLTMIGNDAGAP